MAVGVTNSNGLVKRLGKPPLPPTQKTARGQAGKRSSLSPTKPKSQRPGASVRGVAPPHQRHPQSTDSRPPRNVVKSGHYKEKCPK
jgi:hypothetical protein